MQKPRNLMIEGEYPFIHGKYTNYIFEMSNSSSNRKTR